MLRYVEVRLRYVEVRSSQLNVFIDSREAISRMPGGIQLLLEVRRGLVKVQGKIACSIRKMTLHPPLVIEG